MQLGVSRECFEVIKAGILTTVQDLGRVGYQAYGVVVGGAMDAYALRVGNILVGNDAHAAGLECTWNGPTLLFLADAIVAITGGDLAPTLDGEAMPMWRSVTVHKGSVLALNQAGAGVRAYLCIRGGIDVPHVMGSRATYVRGTIGGYDGRALQRGDRLRVYTRECISPQASQMHTKQSLHPELIPTYTSSVIARVILGPQEKAFTPASIEAFLRERYRITPQSDRMGYRLEGPKLSHVNATDMITDATVMGAVQVPMSGDPIVLMADRQTTGGYPKIATVISVDLGLLAQVKPNDTVRFCAISVQEAQQLWHHREKQLAVLKANFYARYS